MRHWMTPVLAGALAIALATGAWAAGSTSSTSTRSVADKLESAQSAIEAGDYQDSIPILKDVLSKNPKNADALNLLGYAYRELEDLEKADKYYEQALAIEPNHKGALSYLGELYLKLGQLKEAEALLARLDDICTFGCEEYDALKEAIEKYQKTGQS